MGSCNSIKNKKNDVKRLLKNGVMHVLTEKGLKVVFRNPFKRFYEVPHVQPILLEKHIFRNWL